MKVNGSWGRRKGKGLISLLMEIVIMENIKMVNQMVSVPISGVVVVSMKATSKKV